MGNEQTIDSRSQFQGGYLFVKTDKPFYHKGETVYGKIYIRAEVQVNASHLEIDIKGKEKASFHYTTHSNKQTHHHYPKCGRNYFAFKANCYQFNQGPLQPGDYVVPFEFALPEDIPASCYWQQKSHINYDQPKVKVRYSITGRIINHDKTEMKYKQTLMVHEKPGEFLQNHTEEKEFPIDNINCAGGAAGQPSTCSCISKGSMHMKCLFPKNIFYNNEIVTGQMTFNNSKNALKAVKTELTVMQTVDIRSDHRAYQGSFEAISHKDNEVVPPGHQSDVNKEMALDLKNIKYEVNPYKNVKKTHLGFIKSNDGKCARSPEEIAQLSTLAPASNGHYISNNYKLVLDVRLDGCCPTTPALMVPLHIVPIAPTDAYGFLEPQGYAPTDLGYYKLVLVSLPVPEVKKWGFGFG